MRKQLWKGIKRMLPGAIFGSATVAGINLTVSLPVHEVRIEIEPAINLNCTPTVPSPRLPAKAARPRPPCPVARPACN
jgi:hypothetical protein